MENKSVNPELEGISGNSGEMVTMATGSVAQHGAAYCSGATETWAGLGRGDAEEVKAGPQERPAPASALLSPSDAPDRLPDKAAVSWSRGALLPQVRASVRAHGHVRVGVCA